MEILEERLTPSSAQPVHQIDLTSIGAKSTLVTASPIIDTIAIKTAGGEISPASVPEGGYTPDQIRTAYAINGLTFGTKTGDGTGQTIAIVDAYNDPSIFQDLDTFDQGVSLTTGGTKLYSQYGAASKFLKVYDEYGNFINPVDTGVPEDPTGGWEAEESLDVEWAHAIAPGAKIVLVEANSASYDLYQSVVTAAKLSGVSVVSMSWGSNEWSGETALDSIFTTPSGHQGVTFLAAAGDYGSANSMYPAFSPNVVAVGGTTLQLNANNTIQSETAWSTGSDSWNPAMGTGGGTSAYEAEPSYQNGVQNTGYRTIPDVAFDADPNTGVTIFDSFGGSSGLSGWGGYGGTSLATPAWAGLIAIANQGRVVDGLSTLNSSNHPQQTQGALYNLPSSDFHDITSGSNGGYNAGPGYDEVTGLGTPITYGIISGLVGDPQVATPAHVVTQTPTTATLNVFGTDPAGQAKLTYTWSVISDPGSVSFSANGNNAAQTTTATVSAAGDYSLEVALTDPSNLKAISKVTVDFNQVLTSISVAPNSATVSNGTTQQFTATALDQFGTALKHQPKLVWSVDAGGLGSVSKTGLFTAPATSSGLATVRAKDGSVSGTASVTVAPPPPTSITEFPVLTPSSYPVGITGGPDGNVWFTEDESSKIGRITPAGVVTEFSLPPALSQDDASTRGPFGITLGPDGNLWFTENFGPYNSIGKMTTTGQVTEYAIPTLNALPWSIVAGPDGNLWFTEENGDKIGRINPNTGVITEFAVPTPNSGPLSITVGADGNLWFTELAGSKIGRITPAGVITEFTIQNSAPEGITTGSDGNLWFDDGLNNKIGRLNPFTGAVTEFAFPANMPVVSGDLTTGADGNVWFAGSGSNLIGRITPQGIITEYAAPAANAAFQFLTAGPDGNIWFADDVNMEIGRVTLATSSAISIPSVTALGSGKQLATASLTNAGTLLAMNTAGVPGSATNETVHPQTLVPESRTELNQPLPFASFALNLSDLVVQGERTDPLGTADTISEFEVNDALFAGIGQVKMPKT